MALARDPEGIEMRIPAVAPRDRRRGLCLQALQRRPGQTLLQAIGQGVRVAGRGDVAGVEQLQEVDAARAGDTGKPGEPVAADLREVAVAALVAGTGVIHRDVTLDRQPGGHPLLLFRRKHLGIGPLCFAIRTLGACSRLARCLHWCRHPGPATSAWPIPMAQRAAAGGTLTTPRTPAGASPTRPMPKATCFAATPRSARNMIAVALDASRAVPNIGRPPLIVLSDEV